MKFFRYSSLGLFFLISLIFLIMFSTLRTYDYKNKQEYIATYKDGYLIFNDLEGKENIKLIPIKNRVGVKDNEKVNIWYNEKDENIIIMNGFISYWDFFKSIIFCSISLIASIYLIIKEYYSNKKLS